MVTSGGINATFGGRNVTSWGRSGTSRGWHSGISAVHRDRVALETSLDMRDGPEKQPISSGLAYRNFSGADMVCIVTSGGAARPNVTST